MLAWKRDYTSCVADMLNVETHLIEIPFCIEVALLSGASLISILLLIVGRALPVLTWQRSLLEALGASIQGTGCFSPIHIIQNKNMDKDDDQRKVPAFDGKLDSYREYRRRAWLYYYGLEDSKQGLAAPRLIANLSGSAFEAFRERDPGEFRNDQGVQRMLAILDARFQYTPEQEMSEWLETLFFKLRRHQGEETTAFTARFETTLAKAEELVTEELRQDRRRRADLQKAEFRRQSLDYMVRLQQHHSETATTPQGETAPAAPVPPTPPLELPAVEPFRFPEVMKGFLFLRHVGISLQTRASLLRSSGGSLRYESVSELLRRTELDAMVAARTSRNTAQGFLADVPDDDFAEWDDDYDDTDGEDLDEFGGYAEDEEEEYFEDDEPAGDEPPDEEYDTALIGYLEARKKLMSMRRARGFKDPADSSAGGNATTSGKGSKSKGRGRKGSPNSSTSGRTKSDFQWRPGHQSRSSNTPRPRQKTPPPHRRGKDGKKGKGSHRRSQSQRRGDPNGSQYLGWASAEIAPSSAALSATGPAFQPEFSFMATSRSGALPSVTESLLVRYLCEDVRLGLDFEGSSPEVEQACLVTPPGHAIVDTGCTSTLVGAENEQRWREELEKCSGGKLHAERGPSDVRFEGINGEAKASYQVKYPVRLGNRDGFLQAAVIPGRAPFLLSIQALRQMKAKLDCERDTLEIPGIGIIPLKVNQVGHYLLPLFNFQKHHGLSAAAEDEGFGPEGELEIADNVLRPEAKSTKFDPPDPELDVKSHPSSVPRLAEVSKRTHRSARNVLLRLAKETRGPWVPLPKEIAAIYLVLGAHAFNHAGDPWQIRSAQIAYKSKIVRRPPAGLLSEGFVTVVAFKGTSTVSFVVIKDWTKCCECVGQTLHSETAGSDMFLFVYALPPSGDTRGAGANSNHDRDASVASAADGAIDHVLMANCVGDSGSPVRASSVPVRVQDPNASDAESFCSCVDINVESQQHEQLQLHHQAGRPRTATVRSLRSPLGGGLQQRSGDDFSLCHLSFQVQELSRPTGQVESEHRGDHILPSSRLRCHAGTGAFRVHTACHRRCRASSRHRHYHAQDLHGDISVRHPQDHPCTSRCASEGTPIIERFQLYGYSDDSGSESDHQGHDSGAHHVHGPVDQGHDPWRCWHGLPQHSESSRITCSQHDGDSQGGEGYDCQGVRRYSQHYGGRQSGHGCRHGGTVIGASAGVGGEGCRTHDASSATASPSIAANRTSNIIGNIGSSRHHRPSANIQTSRRADREVRSRFPGWLGACAAALVSTCLKEPCLPQPPGFAEVSEEVPDLAGVWPRLSPEIGVTLPKAEGLELPKCWQASKVPDMSRSATRSQLKAWLGPSMEA